MGLVGLVAEVIVLTGIAAGIAANAAVVGGCKMLELRLTGGTLSPWRADIDGTGCTDWNKDGTDLDDWLTNMSRACSMMALVCGFVLGVFVVFNQCLCPFPCAQKIIDLSGLCVQVGLALTWPMIRSEICDTYGGCTWGNDATALLLSQIFYFGASIFTRCMREPKYKRQQERKEDPEPPKEDRKDMDVEDMDVASPKASVY